jgi:uncharacterized protein with HEPN domain
MYPSQVEFLRHILDECNYLQKEFSENTFEAFLQNERLIKAVTRSLEIIGEASAKLHPDLKERYPFIAWREITDMRNRIIHNYFGIDYDIVWNTIKTDIPALRDSIINMIADLESKKMR